MARAIAPTLAAPITLLLLLVAPPRAHAAGDLHTDGRWLRDGRGAMVLLRGLNVAGDAKVPPFRGITDPAQLDPLPAWGVNVVRLLFTWEAYEPSPAQYDEAYLDDYAGVVRAAWARGLWVIVDFHQDAFSRWSLGGCGEGFPKWAIPPTVTPATPDNGPRCADWGQRLISDPALAATWEAFYRDAHGARTRYLAMVARVAARLGAEPAVIGYDLLNEPGGDEVRDLAPLHADAAAAVRAADPRAIVFVTPQVLVSTGRPTRLPRPAFGNFVYAPHYYDASVALLHAWAGAEPDAPFAEMAGQAAAWNAPLLLGEYGAAAGTDAGIDYLEAIARRLDAHWASATQWVYTPHWTPARKDGWNAEDYSIVDDRGALRDNFRPRPYPQRVGGTPTRFVATVDVEPVARVVELEWTQDPAAGETILYVPPGLFAPRGMAIEARGSALACAADGPLRVRCSSTSAGAKHLRLTSAPAPRCALAGVDPALLMLALVWIRRRARTIRQLQPQRR